MFSAVKGMVYLAALAHLPKSIFQVVVKILEYFVLKDLKKDADFSTERVAARIAQGTDRKDFMSPILESVFHLDQQTFR